MVQPFLTRPPPQLARPVIVQRGVYSMWRFMPVRVVVIAIQQNHLLRRLRIYLPDSDVLALQRAVGGFLPRYYGDDFQRSYMYHVVQVPLFAPSQRIFHHQLFLAFMKTAVWLMLLLVTGAVVIEVAAHQLATGRAGSGPTGKMAAGVPLAYDVTGHVVSLVVTRGVVPAARISSALGRVAFGGGVREVAAGGARDIRRTRRVRPTRRYTRRRTRRTDRYRRRARRTAHGRLDADVTRVLVSALKATNVGPCFRNRAITAARDTVLGLAQRRQVWTAG